MLCVTSHPTIITTPTITITTTTTSPRTHAHTHKHRTDQLSCAIQTLPRFLVHYFHSHLFFFAIASFAHYYPTFSGKRASVLSFSLSFVHEPTTDRSSTSLVDQQEKRGSTPPSFQLNHYRHEWRKYQSRCTVSSPELER